MTKLYENTFRAVNIAFANEMAGASRSYGLDPIEVTRAAATKPYGFMPFYPGPGVGGHCIPIDPNYLSHNVRSKLGYPFRFVELAQEINATMPAYVAHRAQNILNSDRLATNGAASKAKKGAWEAFLGRKGERVLFNSVELDKEDLQRLDKVAPVGVTAGDRYPDMSPVNV